MWISLVTEDVYVCIGDIGFLLATCVVCAVFIGLEILLSGLCEFHISMCEFLYYFRSIFVTIYSRIYVLRVWRIGFPCRLQYHFLLGIADFMNRYRVLYSFFSWDSPIGDNSFYGKAIFFLFLCTSSLVLFPLSGSCHICWTCPCRQFVSLASTHHGP